MISLGRLLEDAVQAHPDNVYVRFKDQRIHYGEFNREVNLLANSLHQLGVSKGCHVAALLPNGLDFLFLYFAVAKLGAINILINEQYNQDLLRYALDFTDSRVVVVDERNLSRYGQVRKDLKKVQLEILRSADGQSHLPGSIPFRSLFSGSAGPPPSISILPGDPVQFIFTSGTTGWPKPCIVSHARWIATCRNINQHLQASANDIFFCLLPNCHGNVYGGIFGALLAGASFALEDQFSAAEYWKQVQMYGATVLILHITPMNILLQKPRSEDVPHPARAATFIVGSRAREFLQRFGIAKGLAVYGTTEAGGFCAMKARGPEDDQPGNFCGVEREDMEMRVVDEADEEVPFGRVGEMVVRPRKPFVIFNGYYGMPEQTLEICRNLWLHTGDLGYRDEKGRYFYVGRKSESIRVKGEFILVEYAESILRSHPSIAECGFIGLPSEIGEEDIKVYVKLHDGASLSPEEVISFCQKKMADFMVPRWIEYVEEFPVLSSAMKIDKKGLKDRGIGKAWDRRGKKTSFS